jgi:hypothetical protein
MSAIHPDEISAGRLTGAVPVEKPPVVDKDTIDGTIIDDPSVRAPLVV